METKEQIENLLKSRLIGNVIEEVNLYNVNTQQYDIKDCDRQIVDGGIEIRLDNNEHFSFGWDSKYDFHNIAFAGFETLYTGDEPQKLETKNDYFWKNIIRQRIEDINIQWSVFEVEGNQQLFIPDYIEFQLSFNNRFLVGSMDFEEKEDELFKFKFSLEGWITIFFDNLEIERILRKNAR